MSGKIVLDPRKAKQFFGVTDWEPVSLLILMILILITLMVTIIVMMIILPVTSTTLYASIDCIYIC